MKYIDLNNYLLISLYKTQLDELKLRASKQKNLKIKNKLFNLELLFKKIIHNVLDSYNHNNSEKINEYIKVFKVQFKTLSTLL